jgi:hypothetical protein
MTGAGDADGVGRGGHAQAGGGAHHPHRGGVPVTHRGGVPVGARNGMCGSLGQGSILRKVRAVRRAVERAVALKCCWHGGRGLALSPINKNYDPW